MFDWKNFKKYVIGFFSILAIILGVCDYIDIMINNIISHNWFRFWCGVGLLIEIVVAALICAIVDKKRESRIK